VISFFNQSNFPPKFKESCRFRCIFNILIVALAYFVTGKLGTFLAIPPGYATPIWPPSGIALASMLLLGYRVWPGIILGSFLVNFDTSLASGIPSEVLQSFVITFIIGTGAAIQAVVGAYLLKRFARFPNQLASEKDIFSFMLFGGVASTLINSSIAVSTLVTAGRVPLSNALNNWGVWWIGDIIGILVFTPLVLIWLSRPYEQWRDRRLIITTSILIAFILTTMLASYSHQQQAVNLKLEFDRDSVELSDALEKDILLHMNVLRSIRSFYASSNSVDIEEFQTFTQDPLNRFKGIQALSWNPYILKSDRALYESMMQRMLGRDFEIKHRDNSLQLVRAPNNEVHVAISYIQPLAGNEKAIGFDVYSNAVRRDAINRAIESGKIAATARITLVQEQGDQFGILAFIPIYQNGANVATAAERWKYIEGFAVAVFRGGNIVSAALNNVNRHNLAFRLSDMSAEDEEQLLYESGSHIENVNHSTGLFKSSSPLKHEKLMTVGGRQWLFEVLPTQDYLAAKRASVTWYIILVGLLLTSLIGLIALLSTGRKHALSALVTERTVELKATYDHLHKLSQQIPGVMYQFKLFPDGRSCFPYASEGIRDIYEVTPEQVREDATAVFDILFPDDYDQIVESIQESAKSLTPWDLEYRVDLPKQKVQWLHGHAQPELLDDGSVLWHGFITNITDRKNAEAIFHEIFEQSSFLAGILDQHDNLIMVNKTALSYVSASKDNVTGQYFPDTPWWSNEKDRLKLIKALESAKSGVATSFEATHSDAKDASIRVLFSVTPITLDSGVYVFVTGVDISQRKALEEKLRLLSTAIEQGPTSVVITDIHANLEYANSRFTDITGYQVEDVIGQNPRFLKSGLSNESIYKEMWATLAEGKQWTGELINRRKNGEIYHEEAYISPVTGKNGDVEHYVAVILDISERKEIEKLIHNMAFYDSLTKLANRRLLMDRLDQVMSSNERTNNYGALLFLDLDNFKPLNDTYGHETGDLLLIKVAERLENCVRKMDTVARLGGDEFVVMLPELALDESLSHDQTINVANKILTSISKPYLLETKDLEATDADIEHYCTVSIGCTLFMGHETSEKEVLRQADTAMYKAKSSGRNQISFYDQSEQQ
jgi:diguanylate cyclase (GGDEF)-like protein/PAS domain S-box-containing protein